MINGFNFVNSAMAILRYLILVVALVGMGISTYAQRQIEWYEPDFDSVYRGYWMGFGKHVGGDFVHFYQFWSPTAKSNRIKSILKRKEFKRTSSQHFVEQIEYNQDGFLTHTCYRSFRKTKFGLDTSFVCAEYEIFPSKSGTQITRYYVLSKQNDFWETRLAIILIAIGSWIAC